jgi:hypothetical protein
LRVFLASFIFHRFELVLESQAIFSKLDVIAIEISFLLNFLLAFLMVL